MIVERWGNSLALRLPEAVVEALELKEGDDVLVDVAGLHHLSVAHKPVPAQPRYDVIELLERVRRLRGAVPADFHFDRLEANSR